MKETRRLTLAREAFTGYLSARSLRSTPERLAILDCVMCCKGTFTVAQVWQSMDEGALRVSRATVFNTLALLHKAGLVSAEPLAPGNWRAHIPAETAHPAALSVKLVCRQCGRVRRLRDASLAQALGQMRIPSFVADTADICITGRCKRCRPAK